MNPPSNNSVIDPVCGREVDPLASAAQAEYRGLVYNFCDEQCLEEFQRHPRAYSRHPGQPANWFRRLLLRMDRSNQRALGSGVLCRH